MNFEKYPHCAEAYKYAKDVESGEVAACKWVKLACQRFLNDSKNQRTDDFPYEFRPEQAEKVCNFIELLPHIKGKWAGDPIKLEPWQKFTLVNPFGWYSIITGYRRFRVHYEEVPRKNAKSTKVSGVALYMLLLDGEPGAECYSTATTRDQAKIVFSIAREMAKRSKELQEAYGIEINAHNLNVLETASKFEALSAEGSTLDGLNIHFACEDELHAHKTRTVYDVIETATGSRTQSLIFQITTAGSNLAGVCYDQRIYITKILEGVLKDETVFGIIYTIDDEDDWTDPAVWAKANPNFGVSVFPDDIERKAKRAIEMSSAQNNFLTKHLNKWVNADTAWMNMQKWDACGDSSLRLEDFKGRDVYVGLDLASKIDVASKVLIFPDSEGGTVFSNHYLPEDMVDDNAHKTHGHYKGWALDKHMTLTPGNIIDFGYIKDDLIKDAEDFNIIEVGFDPFQATMFATEMMSEGVKMVEVRAIVKEFSETMKHLESLIYSEQLKHDNNPVLNWMMSNVVAHTDKKDCIYPNKESPENKIDGVVAMIIAMNRLIFAESNGPSVYESRGLLVI